MVLQQVHGLLSSANRHQVVNYKLNILVALSIGVSAGKSKLEINKDYQ
jgi:hypothetical protein